MPDSVLKNCFKILPKKLKIQQTNFLFHFFFICISFFPFPNNFISIWLIQKHTPRSVPRKRCSENMQYIYWRTPMPKYDLNKVAITLWHGCSPVNLLNIFSTPFLKNTSGEPLLLIHSVKIKQSIWLSI